MTADGMPNALLGLDRGELRNLVAELDQPSYRADQIFEAVYRQKRQSVEQISTLPGELRNDLAGRGFTMGWPQIVNQFEASDGTVRYLIECSDGQSVETVWMPEGDGGEAGDGTEAGENGQKGGRSWDRATICVSSQIGCAVDCHFC